MPNTYTVISCHFGDPFWILQSLKRINDSAQIVNYLISDQREWKSGINELSQLNPPLEKTLLPQNSVVREVSPHEINHASLHHGQSINLLIQSERIQSSHIILIDSDCFPISKNWMPALDQLLVDFDAVIASDPNAPTLSHPCFMAIPVNALSKLDFLKGTKDFWIDCGRLIGIQLIDAGFSVKLLAARKAFGGSFGDLYMDDSILHMGSMSFAARPDALSRFWLKNILKYKLPKWIAKNKISFNKKEILDKPLWKIYLSYFLSSGSKN